MGLAREGQGGTGMDREGKRDRRAGGFGALTSLPQPLTDGSMSSRREVGPESALPGWGGAVDLRHLPLAAAVGPPRAFRRPPVGAGGAAAAGTGVPRAPDVSRRQVPSHRIARGAPLRPQPRDRPRTHSLWIAPGWFTHQVAAE